MVPPGGSWGPELTTGPPTPTAPEVCNSPDRTPQHRTDENRMEIYFETLIFVSPLTFLFLFYNPETAVHQPPGQRLHHNVPVSSSAGSQFTVRGRQAGRHRGQQGCSNHQEGEGNPALVAPLPLKEVSVCAVLTGLQPPGKGLLCCLSVRVSQHILTLKAETKQVPRHAIQFT